MINDADSSQLARRRIAIAVARTLTVAISRSVVFDSFSFIGVASAASAGTALHRNCGQVLRRHVIG